eukprot:5121436-Pleurochrysis_carterae.AAC.1
MVATRAARPTHPSYRTLASCTHHPTRGDWYTRTLPARLFAPDTADISIRVRTRRRPFQIQGRLRHAFQ